MHRSCEERRIFAVVSTSLRLVQPIAVLAAVLISSIAHSNPFPTTDQNPFLNGFGVPTPFAAKIDANGTTSVGGTLNWSSTAIIQQHGAESLVADEEGREWRISIAHSFADNIAARIEIPYRQIGGGSLDNFIEHWHSFFGLPKGDRPALPQNAYRLDYRRSNQPLAMYTESSAGVGDVALALGYQLDSTPRHSTSVWSTIKLPTGDDNHLLGSGAIDVALSAAHEFELGKSWSAYSQIDGIYLGRGKLLPDQQRQFMLNALLAIDYKYSESLKIIVQFDGHTSAFKNSALDFLGNAWIMTIGGQYTFGQEWRAQFGVSEDIKVDASPDVVFVLSVAKSWR